ncbi:MAG: hypothetical protein ACK52W_07350 [Alphaproteobacteria bacterium]
MGVGTQARVAGGAILNAGQAIGKKLSGAFKSGEGSTGFVDSVKASAKWMMNEARSVESATKPAASGFWAGVGSVIGGTLNFFIVKPINFFIVKPVAAIMGGSAKAGLWVAKKPVELGLYGVRKGAEFVGRHPGGTLAGVGVGTVAGVGIWAKNRAERQTMESYQQAAAQMQAAQSYMNSVTPQEAAALEAGLAVRSSASGHADKIAADRAAAAQAAASVAG